MNELERSPSLLCDYNINEKKLFVEKKKTKCGKIGEKKYLGTLQIFIKTVVNREILWTKGLKKKRINLCGFFKDKLPGKNLLWSFLVGYFCSQDAFPIPNNPAPPNTSASKHRKCVFSIEYCRKDVNKLDRPKQLVKFIRV